MKVWILFSVANEFEKIYWEKPTKEEKERVKLLNSGNDSYWIEEFKK